MCKHTPQSVNCTAAFADAGVGYNAETAQGALGLLFLLSELVYMSGLAYGSRCVMMSRGSLGSIFGSLQDAVDLLASLACCSLCI